MKGKNYLLSFLLAMMLCFFFFGCVDEPDKGAPPAVKANAAGPSPITETRAFTLEDLIKEAVYNANKEASMRKKKPGTPKA